MKKGDETYTILTECDHCGKQAYCRRTGDPFREEVYGEITEETYWCRDCWQERKWDV